MNQGTLFRRWILTTWLGAFWGAIIGESASLIGAKAYLLLGGVSSLGLEVAIRLPLVLGYALPIGLAQWWVLRRLHVSALWILGSVVGFIPFVAAPLFGKGLLTGLVASIVAGVLAGFVQALMLRLPARQTSIWIAASLAGYTAVSLVSLGIGRLGLAKPVSLFAAYFPAGSPASEAVVIAWNCVASALWMLPAATTAFPLRAWVRSRRSARMASRPPFLSPRVRPR